MSKSLHSHLRERESLRGKITIPFQFAQVFFFVYQPSRFNKYLLIGLAKCHKKLQNKRPFANLRPSLEILHFWACAVPYVSLLREWPKSELKKRPELKKIPRSQTAADAIPAGAPGCGFAAKSTGAPICGLRRESYMQAVAV